MLKNDPDSFQIVLVLGHTRAISGAVTKGSIVSSHWSAVSPLIVRCNEYSQNQNVNFYNFLHVSLSNIHSTP